MPRGIYIITEKHKKNISKALKGKHNSPKTEFKKGSISKRKGIKISEEIKQKISNSLKGEKSPFWGKHLSEETRKKISIAMKGKKNGLGYKHTEEERKKISERNKGNKYKKGKYLSNETKTKMSKAQKGRIVAESTKIILSEINKGENHPRWKGGKLKVVCKYCNKVFKTDRYMIKKGWGNYCSRKCFYSSQIGCKWTEEQKRKKWKGGIKESSKRTYNKLKNTLKYCINHRIRSGIQQSLKKGIKNNRIWQSLVEYNTEQLKRHLKSTMPDNCSWQDFLNGDLHIDHIIPISEFEFDKPEDLQFKKCWELENLRLLSKIENRKKHNKLIKSFQTIMKI